MSEVRRALFEAFRAVWTADSDKLGGGDANAKVRRFVFENDPNAYRVDGGSRTLSPPFIVCDVQESGEDGLGGSTISVEGHDTVVTLHVFTRHDRQLSEAAAQTDQDYIAEDLRANYHERTITSSGWIITDPCWLGGGQAPSNGELAHYAARFSVQIRKAS